MHKCCKCGRTEADSEAFLGFHQFGDHEICDDCAHVYGCNCCQEISDYAWTNYLLSHGIGDRDEF